MSGWSVYEVRARLKCAGCGEQTSGRTLAPDQLHALECGTCGGCEWFHIEDERLALAAEAGGPYR